MAGWMLKLYQCTLQDGTVSTYILNKMFVGCLLQVQYEWLVVMLASSLCYRVADLGEAPL